ncbi:MAG: hypothetical protein LCI00_11525 [Chloroflexi bacterium]|nr:hypothetical protein [Chloroflexota bacterium]
MSRVLLVMIAVFAITGLVSAQPTAVTFCDDLSEADCTLITDSQATMMALESSSFTFDLNVDIDGIEDMPNGLAFTLSGSGATTLDQSVVAKFSDIDPQSFSTNPMAIFDLLKEALPAVGADMQFSLTLPEELLREMRDEVELPETIKLSLKMVDGVIYVNAEELGAYIPQMKGAAGWLGVDLIEAIDMVLAQPGFSDSLKEMENMQLGGMNAEMMQAFSDPETLAGIVDIQRLSDDEVDGKTVAVFETTVDYAALMTMPAMADLMKQQMEASGSEVSDAEIEAMMTMMQTMGKNITLKAQQFIDPETRHLLQSKLDMTFDMSEMMAAAGASSSDSQPVVTIGATFTQGDFNAVEAITKPDGAFLIPLNGMSQSM